MPTNPQVMMTKDHTKWNFDSLLDLIEGPLLNPKRMEEAIKVSRFIKRLISFFHPFSRRFSDLPRAKVCAGLVEHYETAHGPRTGKCEMGQTWMCDVDHFTCEPGRCEIVVNGR